MKLDWMTEQNLNTEMVSLQRATELPTVMQLFNKQYELIEDPAKAVQNLRAIEMFARRGAELIEKSNVAREGEEQSTRTLGNHVPVAFPMFNTQVEGKVDTGATTSSLHAIDISAKGGRVTFKSEMLSPNIITLPMEGTQEVHSADFGGDQRPIVRLDVVIEDVPLKGTMFNLNDRSQMDSKLLIGQDVLKAGNFQVDVSKDQEAPAEETMPEAEQDTPDTAKIYEAIRLLADSDITISDFLKYLQTEAVSRIEG